MNQRFNEFIDEKQLFSKKDKLLLGLSGGADSMALFHLLHENAFNFSVAHINYGLRDAESEEDERFVRELCEKYNVPVYILSIPTSHWERGMNVQAEARTIRYRYFNDLVNELAFTKILTAHHKDDSIETILMNITRGTGVDGLLGIEALSGILARPLLFAERKEIESFLKENNYSWREDSSNKSSKYKRNRFRKEIIPLMREENPSLSEAFDRMIENISSVNEVFNEAYESFCNEFITYEDDQIKIDKQEASLLKRFLFPFLKSYGFNREQTKEMIQTLPNVGKLFVSNTHSLYIDRGELIILKKEDEKEVNLEIVENASALLHPVKLRFSTSNEFKSQKGERIAQFDKDKLTFPLLLRLWKEGDRMQPFGMKGSKKVSDILIDKKISQADKKKIHVLLSNEEIIWIPGIQFSEKVKIEESTKHIWKAELL
jgi:tRNA(Ile)-lysidine synthase